MTRRARLTTTMLVAAGAPFLACPVAHAQSLLTASVDGMTYEVLLPAGYSASPSYPAMLFLTPLDQGNNPSFVNQTYIPQFAAVQAAHPSILVIPLLDQSADPSGQTINFGGVTGSTQGEQNAVAAMQQVMADYNVNKSQVYVWGASMGGQGTDQIMIDYGPNGKTPIFAAGMSMAGTMINMTPQAAAAALGNTPIIAIHGGQDTTNPPVWDQQMAQIDPNFHLTMDPSAGHDVWDGSTGIGNTAALNQLFSYSLSGAPAGTTPAPVGPSSLVTPAAATIPIATAPTATPTATAVPATGQITPGNGSLTDAQGHAWKITAAGSITEDGQYTPGGGGTSALTIGADGTVYGQDNGRDGNTVNSGGWFTLSSDGQSWGKSAPPATLVTDAIPQNIATQAVTAAATPAAPPTPPAPATTPAGLAANYSCNTTTPNSDPSEGGFSTIDGAIYAPGGTPFTARGINLRSTELADIPAVLAAFPGLNYIRLNIRDPQPSPASLVSAVNELTSQGIVVELEYHPNYGGGSGSIGALEGPDVAWLGQAAATFKNNPYVWYGTYNEPPTDGNLSAWHQAEYNAIRGAGATSPILIEPGGSRPWNLTDPLDLSVYKGMENIIADPHVYPYQDDFSADQATNNANVAGMIAAAQKIVSADGPVPVIIGEYGDSTVGAARDQGGLQSVQAVLDSGVGSAAWSWISGGGADALQAGGQLTDYGQMVAAFIKDSGSTGCNISPIAALVPTTQTIANPESAPAAALVPQNSLAGIQAPPGMTN